MKKTIIISTAHGQEVWGKRSPDGKHREYRWSRDRAYEIGDNYIGTLQYHTCNVSLYKIDEANKKLIFAASTAPDRDIYINVLNFFTP